MADAARIVGEELVAFLPNMRRFAVSLCRSSLVADDLVQLACERALASAGSFQPGTRLDAWIFRIIRNLWIDDIRRQRVSGVQDDIADHAERLAGDDGQGAQTSLFLGEVWTAMQTLSAEQREVLMLICVEEFSYREAADMLEVPIGTIMSRLARARLNLAKAVGIDGAPARLF